MELRNFATATLLTTLWLVVSSVLLPKNLATLDTLLQQAVSGSPWRRSIHKIGTQMIVAAPQRAADLRSYQALPLNGGFRVTEQPAELGKFISVKAYGAVGNGKVDDTTAIQRTIDAVYNAGGGVVFFPRGTYKVTINPSTLQAITIRAKVTLKGNGNRNSVIKLADRQGNYNSILAGATPSSDLSDFAMYDLAVDGNGSNNPVTAETDFHDNIFRHALRIYVGARIHIERCRFTNQNNVNTITTNGEFTVSDVWITDNVFELIGGGTVDYDHSTIFTLGKRIQISNNSFSSRNGAGTKGARTAIEIHGDNQSVTNNKISGFTYGINVTGIADSSNSQTITGNVMKDVYTGILIWSYFSGNNTANPALTNCLIANNEIHLNVNSWRPVVSTDTMSVGIFLEPNSNAPIKNLDIVNNRIYFTNFLGNGRASDNLSNGINLWRAATPNVATENLHILGNTIENSPGAGIYIYMPIKLGEISRNTIVNSGVSTNPFHDDYRSAIIVVGDFENVQINDNLMSDNQVYNTMKVGILGHANCVANCEAKGNLLRVASGAKIEVFRSNSRIGRVFHVSP